MPHKQHSRPTTSPLFAFMLLLIGLICWTTIQPYSLSKQSGPENHTKDNSHSSISQNRKASSDKNIFTASPVSGPTRDEIDKVTQACVSKIYDRMPLNFEANRGQVEDEVKYFSRSDGYNLFLTATEAVLALNRPRTIRTDGRPPLVDGNEKTQDANTRQMVLRMKLLGANTQAEVRGLDEQPGQSNYFIGNDPAKWRTHIARYARVHYEDVYPGVDLVYYGKQHHLEYDFLVAAGADPKAIRLKFSGAQNMRIDRQGDLILSSSGGNIRQHKPLIYQEVEGKRKEIAGRYVLLGEHEVSFEISSYDTNQQLVIDPVLSYAYSTYWGTSRPDFGESIAVDAAGNTYVTGQTQAVNVDNLDDAFVIKYDAIGKLVYETIFGGNGFDGGKGIAVDAAGNAYITGRSDSTNFPLSGAMQPYGGSGDAFVTKLNADGDSLPSYSTYLGGSASEQGYAIAVDSSGNAYVTGTTFSSNFPTTPGALQASAGGASDAFIVKLNSAGSSSIYSTYFGGGGSEQGRGIGLDAAGNNAYVTGFTDAPESNGNTFVAKLNVAGSGLLYNSTFGGSGAEQSRGIAVDASGNAYVTGSTSSSNLQTSAGAYQTINRGGTDAYVAKFDTSGSRVYTTYLGGSGDEIGWGIAVDATGSAYVAGSTLSSSFPTANPKQPDYGGNGDAFVTKLNAAGSGLTFSTFLGGDGSEQARCIAVDVHANAYVTGRTSSGNFPKKNPAQSGYAGATDAFITKYNFVPDNVTPLIFIPGIAGSYLKKLDGDQSELWPGGLTTSHEQLSLDNQSPNYRPFVNAPDVIRTVSLPVLKDVKVYTPLLEALHQAGYAEDGASPTLFVFPYDWRKSNIENAAHFKGFVDYVRSIHPGSKVNILTHSMGGLLARRYLLDYPAPESHHVDKLVTIAAPWLGAPKVLLTLENGEFLDSPMKYIVGKGNLKTLVEFFPSAHELMPSKAYFDLGGRPYAEDGWDINGNGIGKGLFASETYSYDQMYSLFNYRFPRSIPAITGAFFHDHAGQDDWRSRGLGVSYFHIYGVKSKADTIGQLVAKLNVDCVKAGEFSLCIFYDSFETGVTKGDGTVPTLSAERIGNGLNHNVEGATLMRFDAQPSDDGVEHLGLTQNAYVHQYILSILNSPTSSFPGKRQVPMAAPETQQAYYLRLAGATSATLTDTLGNTSNPLGDGPEAGVPGVTSYRLAPKVFLSITPTDQTYTLAFKTGSDPLSLKLTKGTDVATAQAIRYLDLNLPPNTNAQLQITPQGVEDLRYDSNGDGTYDAVVAPTISVTGPAAQDTEPPIISVNEKAQPSNVQVNINATDSGSGVKQVFYSLDGSHYQPYTAPLALEPDKVATLYTFAEDNLANRSSLLIYQLQSCSAVMSAGTNVSQALCNITIMLNNVTAGGTIIATPVEPNSQGTPPPGYIIKGPAYDIQTAATYSGPVNICFSLPSITDQAVFSHLKVLHAENGVLIDKTSGQNFETKTLCARADSLSPFVIAQGLTPTAAPALVSGRVTTANGSPLGGVTLTLRGADSRRAITNNEGVYLFTGVETGDFYSLIPERANYTFSPVSHTFSLIANKTDGAFTASPIAETANPLDTTDFFVRQQYLDFLGREPDQVGFEYWSAQLSRCSGDATCLRERRIDVSAAFLFEPEFEQTGAYLYCLYKASFGLRPTFAQFMLDRKPIVTGINLDQSKTDFALEFVQRDGFLHLYPRTQTAEQFVDALLGKIKQNSKIDLSLQRGFLMNLYDGTDAGRAFILRRVVENQIFIDAEYNNLFVLMEYFGYLRRDPDQNGFDFWLGQVNKYPIRDVDIKHAMACSFITSKEYQTRFSSVVTHSNRECSR